MRQQSASRSKNTRSGAAGGAAADRRAARAAGKIAAPLASKQRATDTAPTGHFDDVSALLVFARVIQRRSFTQAARELDTSTSAVSKRIANLERRVGAQLLTRTTRQVTPTEAGLSVYQHCLRILREVEDAEHAVAGFSDVPRGLLKVSAPVYFGELHVAPLLAELVRKNPELRVELSLSDRFVDLVAEGFDLAVRIGRVSGASLMARTLCRSGMLAAASPDYFQRRGRPESPEELLEHDCLRYTHEASLHAWIFRSPNGEPLTIPITGSFESNHGGALREAAVAGLGVCYLPAFYLAEAVEQGSLETVLTDFSGQDLGIHGVYPSGRIMPPKTRACLDYLAETLAPRLARCASRTPRARLRSEI
jgi:DNA-binding transcriptional LysR family regulator